MCTVWANYKQYSTCTVRGSCCLWETKGPEGCDLTHRTRNVILLKLVQSNSSVSCILEGSTHLLLQISLLLAACFWSWNGENVWFAVFKLFYSMFIMCVWESAGWQFELQYCDVCCVLFSNLATCSMSAVSLSWIIMDLMK